MIHAGAVGLVLIIGFLSVVVGVVVLPRGCFGAGGYGKRHPVGVPCVQKPSRIAWWLLYISPPADPQGPSGQVQSVRYGASFKFLMH